MSRLRATHFLTLALTTGFALTADPLSAAEPLKWKWAEGDSARYELVQTMRMSMDAGEAGEIESNTNQGMLLVWTVESVDADKGAVIQQATERAVMQIEGPRGRSFSYDTAEEDPPTGMSTMVAPMLDALVSAPYTVTMLSSGKVTDVQLSEELAEAFKKLPGGSLTADMVAQLAKQSTIEFFEDAIEVGDEWSTKLELNAPQVGKMEVVNTYTYQGPKEIEGRQLEAFAIRIDLQSVDSGSTPMEVSITMRESSGELLFDREAGRIYSANTTQVMDIGVTIPGATGDQTVHNQVTQTLSLRALGDDETPDLGLPAATAQQAPAEPTP